ncbi:MULTISPECIES: F0F1 ATP synthase subunit delta [Vibrio]|uniref:ATP synthase subunit delta n=2 Tax=Vibrio mediterranei TaxID=689 RepID=A0A2S9ZGW2_9VIBR|nr:MULTISPECIES: F0F1 ATP synthase subunit delta [Vibrio]AYV23897.1 F0F1 ATP synthase subunit delta [Vibrio mediterranei]KFA95357.1 ATP synthase subunit delta [Vibrio sp. ER1A]MCF4173673.1 F0F1 ATP synthase subunit delta [Vibrio sp. McD22-P3]MCG9627091.1 F0F1 ATP synthase subunit delta [Vibrio mediterranei]MCG9658810.1 F0F1 ATP synthase subunit delta [Vibrio mediterranei]
MNDFTSIAQPYAKAAFDFALDEALLDEWGQALGLLKMVVSQPAVVEVIEDLEEESSEQVLLDMILTSCDEWLSQYVKNFLRVMAENKRLKLLATTVELFFEMKAEYEKTMEVLVYTAEPLEQDQLVDIKNALEAKFGKTVTIEQQIDPSLVGGVMIKAGEQVLDGSIYSSLHRLAVNLHA